MSNNLHDRRPAELEKIMDEVHSRLARAYGKSKAEIAKLAVKRYGGDDMTERTEEVLANARSLLSGGREDAMDKMIKWEMIRDMRAQRNNPQPVPIQQPQPQQMQQPAQEKMTMQDMMMMLIMPQMVKAMAKGDEDDLLKIYKYKMMMGGEDGKGMNLEKLELMMKEEREASDARVQQFMSTVLGQQEAEKIREKEERYRREMEQRLANAEYMARHPTMPQEPFQTARDKLDESVGMMMDVKSKMEEAGMVQRPESTEDKVFTKDMTELKHKQSVETEAVKQLAKSADKLSDTADKTLNKAIDLMAEEQRVKQRQFDMASPEERKKLQQQYEALGDQVLREQDEPTPSTPGSLDITEEDDLDANE